MKYLVLLPALALLAFSTRCPAQAGAPQIPERGEPTEELRTRNAMSQSEIKRVAEMVDQWNRTEGKGGVSPREARRRTAQMLKVLAISCDLVDAAYRGRVDDMAPHLYEASCTDGMGYLLALAGESLSGVSCLVGGEGGPAVACTLPANADRTRIAEAVLRKHSVSCSARDVKWLGADAGHFDYVEVACPDSAGYVVKAPHPGHGGELKVITCQDAGSAGIRCGPGSSAAAAPAADTGNARPTLDWFKQALARNGTGCQTKRARIVGRESIKRRYIVEFECADRPEGLVAIVPAAGDAVNAFESLNCAAAVSRGVHCEFLPEDQAAPVK